MHQLHAHYTSLVADSDDVALATAQVTRAMKTSAALFAVAWRCAQKSALPSNASYWGLCLTHGLVTLPRQPLLLRMSNTTVERIAQFGDDSVAFAGLRARAKSQTLPYFVQGSFAAKRCEDVLQPTTKVDADIDAFGAAGLLSTEDIFSENAQLSEKRRARGDEKGSDDVRPPPCPSKPNLVLVLGQAAPNASSRPHQDAARLLVQSLGRVALCPVRVAFFVQESTAAATAAAISAHYKDGTRMPLPVEVYSVSFKERDLDRGIKELVRNQVALLQAATLYLQERQDVFANSMHVPLAATFQWDLLSLQSKAIPWLHLTTAVAARKAEDVTRTCGHPLWRKRRTRPLPSFAAGDVTSHLTFLQGFVNFVAKGHSSTCTLQLHMEAYVWRGSVATEDVETLLSPPSLGPVVSLAPARLHRPPKGRLPPGLELVTQSQESENVDRQFCLLANTRGVAAVVMDYGAVHAEAVCGEAAGCTLQTISSKMKDETFVEL